MESLLKFHYKKVGVFPLKFPAAIFRKTAEIKEKLANFLEHLGE